MNKDEAGAVLEAQLACYRELPYAELLRLRDESVALEVEVDGGTTYQVKIYAFWDGEPGGDLRVCGAIDDGGWRAFSPLTCDFIISPDGSFVGE
jgi:hypothetical protein